MSTTLTITCRDTDDPEYWGARLNAADREDYEALLDSMLGLSARLASKGIPAPWVSERMAEGMDIYLARFGDAYVPF